MILWFFIFFFIQTEDEVDPNLDPLHNYDQNGNYIQPGNNSSILPTINLKNPNLNQNKDS